MKARRDGVLDRLASAGRPTRPWLHVKASPWWLRVLTAAGARPVQANEKRVTVGPLPVNGEPAMLRQPGVAKGGEVLPSESSDIRTARRARTTQETSIANETQSVIGGDPSSNMGRRSLIASGSTLVIGFISGMLIADRRHGTSTSVVRPPDPSASPIAVSALVIRIPEEYAEVLGVAFSADGKTLATAGTLGHPQTWSLSSGAIRSTFEYPALNGRAVAFSRQGSVLAVGSSHGFVRLWDVTTGRALAILRGHTAVVNSVAFSPDGSVLASCDESGVIRLWNFPAATSRAVLSGSAIPLYALAFSPDGFVLAAGDVDGIVHLWDIAAAGEERALRQLDLKAQHVAAAPTEFETSVAFSPGGSMLATNAPDNSARLWDVATGTLRATLVGHEGQVTSVAFSPDGSTLVTGSADRTAKLWATANAVTRATLTGHTEVVTSVAFSPDGTLLATGSADTTARVWSVSQANSEAPTRQVPTGPAAASNTGTVSDAV